jgi:hypothetical protein
MYLCTYVLMQTFFYTAIILFVIVFSSHIAWA